MNRLIRWRVAGAFTAVLAFSLPALAEAPSAEDIKAAADAFDQGKRAYKDRKWAAAAEQFEAADRSAPAPVALEFAMKAREKAGQLDRAATLAALALDRHPTETKLAKEAGQVLERAEKTLHRVRVKCDPPCDLVIGTKLVHGRPGELRTVFLPVGDHTVRAGWSGGRSESADVKAIKGGRSELTFTAPAEKPEAPAEPVTSAPTSSTPSPQPTPKPDPTAEASSGMSPAVFFVGAGLTVAAGAATVWSGLDTQNNPGTDRVKSECAGQGPDCPAYQDGLSRQRRTNVLIGVTAGLGVVTGVVGAFFTDWGGGSKGPEQAAHVEPWVSLGSVGARGRF